MAKKKDPENDMKLQSLEISNFKNIDRKVVEIGGRSLLIMGPNRGGKSSMIQAMIGGLDSKWLPTVGLKAGEEEGHVSEVISGVLNGQPAKYTIQLFFSQKNQKGRLRLLNEAGEEMKSPATKIKDIIGNVSFDVTSWLKAKPEEKLKTIKQLTGKGQEIDILNDGIKTLKEQRKMKDARAKELEGALNNHGIPKEDIPKYANPVPIEPIQEEFNTVAKNQGIWDNVNNQLNAIYTNINVSNQNIERANNEINRINSEIERLMRVRSEQDKIITDEQFKVQHETERAKQGEVWKQQTPRPTLDEVNAKLTAATEHNAKHARLGQLHLQHQEMTNLKKASEECDMMIQAKENMRDKVIRDSQLPIDGLSFTDNELFIGGLPLEEGQQNTEHLFNIGVDIAIALNPNLKVIFLHEGNLLDKNNMKKIVEKIENNGYMAVIEFVNWEGDEFDVKFTEQFLN